MALERKGNTTAAFRYFVFILFLCIFLFVFLITRLMTGFDSAFNNDQFERPSYRVEVMPPSHLNDSVLRPASTYRNDQVNVHPLFQHHYD